MIILEWAIVTLRRSRHTSSISQSSSSSYINLNTSLRSCSASVSTSSSVELIVSRMRGEVMTSVKWKSMIHALELIHSDGILLLLLRLLLNYNYFTQLIRAMYINRHRILLSIISHLSFRRYRISSLSCHLPISQYQGRRDSLYRNQPEQPIPTISLTRSQPSSPLYNGKQ